MGKYSTLPNTVSTTYDNPPMPCRSPSRRRWGAVLLNGQWGFASSVANTSSSRSTRSCISTYEDGQSTLLTVRTTRIHTREHTHTHTTHMHNTHTRARTHTLARTHTHTHTRTHERTRARTHTRTHILTLPSSELGVTRLMQHRANCVLPGLTDSCLLPARPPHTAHRNIARGSNTIVLAFVHAA